MTDIGHFGFSDDVAFAFHLVEKFGVATVPGVASTATLLWEDEGSFLFSKKKETLEQAAEKLRSFKGRTKNG